MEAQFDGGCDAFRSRKPQVPRGDKVVQPRHSKGDNADTRQASSFVGVSSRVQAVQTVRLFRCRHEAPLPARRATVPRRVEQALCERRHRCRLT